MPVDRKLIEAKLAMGLIDAADMPGIAVEALEADLDGKAVRRLAVLERPTYFVVADLLPRVMQELDLRQISLGEAGLRIALAMVKDILRQNDDPRRHLEGLESLWVRSGYAREIKELGTLNDDIWVRRFASDQEERDWVLAGLRAFLQKHDVARS
jgi:hypothetical protein